MIPAKNRDRKCSTCRHYQPSPLWRKGWCRNPLLYDRNTNHLVEADSLACNRTFIDYWEPATGPAPSVGPAARSPKPRIAPSIPIGTTDAQGNRAVVTGNTVPGMPGVTGREAAQALDRPVPRLAVVTEDFEPPLESPSEAPADSKVTRLIPEVEAADDVRRGPALRRSRAVRDLRTQLLSTTGGRIGVAIAALVILLAVVTAVVYARNLGTSSGPALAPTAVATQPLPTPTGFGDATATPATTPVPAGPPPGQLGINGWAQVAAGGSLVVRQAPSKAGKRITSLRDGVKVQIVDGPQQADDLTWWKIQGWDARNPQNAGWSAGKYLQPIPAPAP